ncbi:NADH-quinone oxidoreductase subunit J [Mumia flava]|uniref:NADH-quinone oxidoreductase subunit J n=1 Tax=Mumia flava TaxID=1348852 RepID=A0A0B2B9I4_9ACTN|nr:NADH-quinone oxidoreductase subunit J [Mumia flava]PJJ58253.1 NADH-quinone oxidoreductase subunit J [Mumia flava]
MTAFWLLAPIVVVAAVGMVVARKAVHSALMLAVVMIGLAMMYAMQDAPFLFAVQIIVYTGAIMMLFLFVLMLVGVDKTDSLVETLKGQRLVAILLAVLFGVVAVVVVAQTAVAPAVGLDAANEGGNVQAIADLLFSPYVFALEATAALLITAVLGAMVLAHRERLEPKRTQKDLALERMQRYADDGTHPGNLPTPGVFARHNAVDVPALLPDGSAAPESTSKVLRDRGAVRDGVFDRDVALTLRRLASDDPVGGERGVIEPGPTDSSAGPEREEDER